MKIKKDWTEESIKNFVFYIASDFVDRLEEEMKELRLSRKALAGRLGVSPGRVSQFLNDPGNLTLESIVEYARAVGIKVALLAYNDGDKDNLNGPIVPEVFHGCWERCGRPRDMFAFNDAAISVSSEDLNEVRSLWPNVATLTEGLMAYYHPSLAEVLDTVHHLSQVKSTGEVGDAKQWPSQERSHLITAS